METPPLQPPQPPAGQPPGYDPSLYAAYPYGPPQPGPYPYGPPQKRRGLPGWAIVLIVLAVVGPVMAGILAAISIPMFLSQHDRAKDSSVKEGAHSIQTGIQTWAVENGDTYPQPDEVSLNGGVARYVDPWPTNPWTGGPMEPGTSRGDYRYEVTPDGFGYGLIVFLSNGEALKIR